MPHAKSAKDARFSSPHPPNGEYVFSVLAGTLSGFGSVRSSTQGSSFLATLGCKTQSRWDCGAVNRYPRRFPAQFRTSPYLCWLHLAVFAVISDCLNRAAFLGLFAAGFFFRRFRLFVHE